MIKLRTKIGILSLLLYTHLSYANSVPVEIIPHYNMNYYNKVIITLYKQPGSQANNILDRINVDSAYFLAKPYHMFPVGEGEAGEFDKSPLYRTDIFDCMTYVTTVLALARGNNLAQFQQNFISLSYQQDTPDFINRNHFVESDWNVNNARKGYIKDITTQFKQVKILYANTWINKPLWYKQISPQRIRLFVYPDDNQAQLLLSSLRAHAKQVSAVQVHTPYIPLTMLYDSKGQPNMAIFNQIPSGSIIEIVRPNWNLTPLIGTNLNISHLGFAIRTPQGLVFRESSLDQGKVIQVSLTNYLKQFLNTSVKGINVELPL